MARQTRNVSLLSLVCAKHIWYQKLVFYKNYSELEKKAVH